MPVSTFPLSSEFSILNSQFSIQMFLLSEAPEPGEIHWRSPSNIALVKYWGKRAGQLPRNPSLSFTLSAAFTETLVEYAFDEEQTGRVGLEFFFHSEANEAFEAKIRAYLESLDPIFPFLKQLKLVVHSGNSFPHSAGIASSASAMSALALCLCSMEDRFFGTLADSADFDRKASLVARLGSGSACRSIFPGASVWGATPSLSGSSDEFGVGIEAHLHPVFRSFLDDILIVSSAEKSVSSRAGHGLMDSHPRAEARYAQARGHLADLLKILADGDLEGFAQIVETEADTLHELMRTGEPAFDLLKPNSLKIMEKVQAYRAETGIPLCYTLDAGPNVHLLYPEEYVTDVRGFIESDLRGLCEDGFVLNDWVGEGPEEV